MVKIADLGLAKDVDSTFTRSKTGMRGTIRDPLLANFKDFGKQNEIYAIGHMLSYIFTGRDALASDSGTLGEVVQRCSSMIMAERYDSVQEVIAAIEAMSSIS